MIPSPDRATPTPAELLDAPERAMELRLPDAASMLARFGAVEAVLRARLAAPAQSQNGERPGEDDLDAEQVAKRLGMSKRWVYQNGEREGFAVRRGRAKRFPARLVEKYREEQERRASRR